MKRTFALSNPHREATLSYDLMVRYTIARLLARSFHPRDCVRRWRLGKAYSSALSKEDAARLDEELARLSPEQQKAIEDTTPTDFIRRAAEDQQLMNIVAREDPQLAEKVRRFVAEFQADARTVAAAKGFDPEAADMGAAFIVVTETLRPQSSQHTTTDHEVRSPPLEREPPISFRGGTS
jgi:hypothetical protein